MVQNGDKEEGGEGGEVKEKGTRLMSGRVAVVQEKEREKETDRQNNKGQ